MVGLPGLCPCPRRFRHLDGTFLQAKAGAPKFARTREAREPPETGTQRGTSALLHQCHPRTAHPLDAHPWSHRRPDERPESASFGPSPCGYAPEECRPSARPYQRDSGIPQDRDAEPTTHRGTWRHRSVCARNLPELQGTISQSQGAVLLRHRIRSSQDLFRFGGDHHHPQQPALQRHQVHRRRQHHCRCQERYRGNAAYRRE